MLNRTTILSVTLLGAALLGAPLAAANTSAQASSNKAFGNQYTDVAPVSAFQSQVVYFRPNGMGLRSGAANVYVDREFHTALLPGGYTAFCVAPGQHSLGAYVNDAPKYAGKSTDVYSTHLEAGKTYFLQVREDGYGAPQAVSRADAESALRSTRTQVQALSRASTVVACDYQAMPVAPVAAFKDYALSSDVLFAFSKSDYKSISSGGRIAIRELITQLHREHAKLDRVEVIGHTDPIGSAASNQLLGLKRAQTVRRLLVDGGLPSTTVRASSAGATEQITSSCEAVRGRADQIACYRDDRRVVVRVSTGG